MFALIFAFALCFATTSQQVAENKRLKSANQALLQALRSLSEVEASVGSDSCEGKKDRRKGCEGALDLEAFCPKENFQKFYCPKSCCELNQACTYGSCEQCVSANDNGKRVCDWIDGACTQVSPNRPWPEIEATFDCPSAEISLEKQVGGPGKLNIDTVSRGRGNNQESEVGFWIMPKPAKNSDWNCHNTGVASDCCWKGYYVPGNPSRLTWSTHTINSCVGGRIKNKHTGECLCVKKPGAEEN